LNGILAVNAGNQARTFSDRAPVLIAPLHSFAVAIRALS
jgi:hypothetical protein